MKQPAESAQANKKGRCAFRPTAGDACRANRPPLAYLMGDAGGWGRENPGGLPSRPFPNLAEVEKKVLERIRPRNIDADVEILRNYL